MADSPSRPHRRLLSLLFLSRRRAAKEMELELESHLAMRAADLERAGIAPDAARLEAERYFGDFENARRRLKAVARQRAAAIERRDRVGALRADLRFGFRQVRRSPGFAIATICTFMIGLGLTTATFTLLDHILLRPLPFAQADRLYVVTGLDSLHKEVPYISSADWLDWRKARSLQGSAIISFAVRQPLVFGDSSLRVSAERVSANYFDVLQPHFRAGHGFTEAGVNDQPNVVVISERLWQSAFDADPSLSKPLRTSRRAYTVAGVVAAGDEFPSGTDVWFPVVFTPATDPARVNINYLHLARLGDGVAPERATAELSAIALGVHATDVTARYDFGATLKPLSETLTGWSKGYLGMLFGVAALVLLIVCANTAAASLARGAARTRELAVRRSLGATGARLVQQMLVEHVSLALAGGVLGLGVAWAVLRVMIWRWGPQIPRAGEISLDWPIFAFALAGSIVAGVLTGLVPALKATRAASLSSLSGGRTVRGGRRLVGGSVVVGEVAVAILLITGAGLLVRSLRALVDRGLGLDTNVATAEAALSTPLYAADSSRRLVYWNSLLEQYRSIPGVRAVALANPIPLGLTGQGFIDIAGRDVPGAGAVYRAVSADFFGALDIPLLAGRDFNASDGPDTPPVVIINRAMARKYWPGASPIGERVRATSMEGSRATPAPWRTIVGVVGDIRAYGLQSDELPEMYSFYQQAPGRTSTMTALVRGQGWATALFKEMRRRARVVDRQIPVDVSTIDQLLQGTLGWRTLTMSLLTALAGISLSLAALGIFDLLSFAVAQRARELAVRAALGAQPRDIVRIIAGAGARVVFAGVVIGGAAALALTRVLNSMLFAVTSRDPVNLAVAAGILACAAALAALLPAYRASRVDPAKVLQSE